MTTNPGGNELFSSLRREVSLVNRVAEQLEDLILSGQLRPGDILPPEARLAKWLGVSRTVVREASSRLLARHLLQPQDNGLAVSSPTPESVGRSMSAMLRLGGGDPAGNQRELAKVLEVRRLLEAEIARLAALRRTDDDLDGMRLILQEAENAQADPVRFPALDVAFHRALAQATQNDLFLVLLDALADTMMTFRRIGYQVPGMPARSLHHHRAVLEQVIAQSPEGARTAMLNHMREAEDTVREAQARATMTGEGSDSRRT